VRSLLQGYFQVVSYWLVLPPLLVIVPVALLWAAANKDTRNEFMRRLARGNRHNPWLMVASAVLLASSITTLIDLHGPHLRRNALIILGASVFMLVAFGVGYRRGGAPSQ
jgi:hypothetical protein